MAGRVWPCTWHVLLMMRHTPYIIDGMSPYQGLLAVQNVCCEHEFEDWHCRSAQCWQGTSQEDVIARCFGLLANPMEHGSSAKCRTDRTAYSCSQRSSMPSARIVRPRQQTIPSAPLSPMLALWQCQTPDYRSVNAAVYLHQYCLVLLHGQF